MSHKHASTMERLIPCSSVSRVLYLRTGGLWFNPTLFQYSVLTLSSIYTHFNPFPNDKFLDSSKTKEFADDNFKFDGNGRKFFKRVENTVGKGEIACFE